MEMGVLKPFDITSSARTGVSVEAARAGSNNDIQTGSQAVITPSVKADTESPGTQQPVSTDRVETDREALVAAVSDMQNFVQSVQRDINFNVDDSSGRVVINVTEASSGEVIRQIPSEEALRLSENLSEIRSLLFKAEA